MDYPTLGPQVCDFIEERFVYGPGSVQGQPVKLDIDQRELLWYAYEHYPKGFTEYGESRSGKRRFQRVSLSVRKGSAKTELLALVVACELHPESPVRFTGYDPTALGGLKTGKPVNDPYIPMLAYTKDQVSELGYGALMSILETCDDADMFHVTNKEIIRLNANRKPDGKAVPMAGTPGALDGARTTMQALDETHRLYLPNHKAAIETMLNNLPKRPLEDPWQFSTTTAGEPGQESYAEDEYKEGLANWEGREKTKSFYFMHRQAGDTAKFDTMENRIAAIKEATGPGVLSWGASQIIGIAEMWDRKGVDRQYLERVWGNRWTQTDAQAFNKDDFEALGHPSLKIPDGAFITLGFDGAVRDDATGLVATDIKTGVQNVLGCWEHPPEEIGPDGNPVPWRVPEDEVDAAFESAMERFEVWRAYCDPPHWIEVVGKWAGKYPDKVVEFWTKNETPMYYAVKNYNTSIANGDVSHDGDPDLVRHIGNAGKLIASRGLDEDGQQRFRLRKIAHDRKMDLAVCAVLSWKARMDALAEGAEPEQLYQPQRVR